MIATLAISTSQLLVGFTVDRVSVRVLVAVCGSATLAYSIVWRALTRRLLRRAVPAVPDGAAAAGAAGVLSS